MVKVESIRVEWGLFEGGLADRDGVVGEATAADISHVAILLSMTFFRSNPFHNVSKFVKGGEE